MFVKIFMLTSNYLKFHQNFVDYSFLSASSTKGSRSILPNMFVDKFSVKLPAIVSPMSVEIIVV